MNKFKDFSTILEKVSFSTALEFLRDGYVISREGWNGNKLNYVPEYPEYTPTERVEYIEALDLVYILLSDNSVAVCDGCDYERVKEHKWTYNKGYAVITDNSGDIRHTIKLHNYILDFMPSDTVIDHINGNTLDNRRCNLRVATHRENNANRRGKEGTSKYKGVSWDSSRSKWISSIQYDKHTKHIGRFDSEIEAAKAYDTEAYKLYGDFARLNFPEDKVNMFLYMVDAASYPARMDIAKAVFGDDALVPYEPYIAMKNAQGTINVWAPSQMDMFSDDWMVLSIVTEE